MTELATFDRFAKRALDIIGSALVLLGFGVPMLGLAVMVRVNMGPPVLFRQVRVGRRGREFTLLKFRTMTPSEGRPIASSDDGRVASFGRVLRRLSIDELPSFLNVLTGEMSLVGPRPLLPDYVPLYTATQARRHEVKPGITGWAQVNGRNGITWEDKFNLDVWYVDNCSLSVDLKILWLTMAKVLKGDGVSAEGYATMPPFVGSTKESENGGDV